MNSLTVDPVQQYVTTVLPFFLVCCRFRVAVARLLAFVWVGNIWDRGGMLADRRDDDDDAEDVVSFFVMRLFDCSMYYLLYARY